MAKTFFSRVARAAFFGGRCASSPSPSVVVKFYPFLAATKRNFACQNVKTITLCALFACVYRCVIMTNIIFSVMRRDEEAICCKSVIAVCPFSPESVDLDYSAFFFLPSFFYLFFSFFSSRIFAGD